MPPVHRVAGNFARAVVRTVSHVVKTGKVVITREQQIQHEAICRGCEFFNANNERCSHKLCGCCVKFKTWLRSQQCPAGKWDNTNQK